MKILLTGATGYIAQKLLPVFLGNSHEVICKENNMKELPGISPVSYEDATREAFGKMELNQVPSGWKDALTSNTLNDGISKYAQLQIYGCFIDNRKLHVNKSEESLIKMWSIGGKNGWHYSDWLWVIYGFIDELFGGVGLRRGRKNQNEMESFMISSDCVIIRVIAQSYQVVYWIYDIGLITAEDLDAT